MRQTTMSLTTVGRLSGEADDGEIAISCPVCGSKLFDILLDPEQVEAERRWLHEFYRDRAPGDAKEHAEFTQCEATHIVACRTCETVLRNPRPTGEELDRRYQLDHYGRRTLEQLFESERDFFRDRADRFAAVLPRGAAVLEVGSFVGAFLHAAKDLGWKASGVDIGEETSEFCRCKGLHVQTVDLEHIRGRFDAVFIWNTFDQLPDPRATLRLCFRLLTAGGLLVLRVPNGRFERLALQLRRERPSIANRVMAGMAYNNFLTFPYLAGYTPDSISKLLDQESFSVQSIEGDTILPLATEETPSFAVREERLYKRAVMRACRLVAGETSCPWIDVVALRSH